MLKISKYRIFIFLIFNIQNIKTADKLNEELLQAVMDDASPQIIQKLIAEGADVNYNREGINILENTIDNKNDTARRCRPVLDYAIINENVDLMEMLFSKGASANYINPDGYSPNEFASMRFSSVEDDFKKLRMHCLFLNLLFNALLKDVTIF